jgi:DNA-binding transcriptional regulator YdaS (Cro superfamily)
MAFPDWAETPSQQHEYLLRLAALHSAPGGSIYALSLKIGRSRAYLADVIANGRVVTAEDALKIVEAAPGAVTRGELRQDIWPDG